MIHGGNVWQGASPDAWLDFSANLRPEGMPDWVRAAILSTVDEVRYYPDLSMRAAREGLAAYAGVPPECVLPTSGGIEAIDLVCRGAAGRVFVCPPTFGEYARRALSCGREVADASRADALPSSAPLWGHRGCGAILPFADAGDGLLREGCGRDAATPFSDARAGDTLFVCNPNNPTGALIPREEILGLARATKATLCVDEAFIDLCPEESVRDRAAAEKLVVVGSLTKALCAPGVRLGYLIAAPDEVAWYEHLTPPWSLNAFAAAIARELPLHLDELAEDRRRNDIRRAALADDLRALGADVSASRTNFLLVDFHRPMGDAVAYLKSRGILVRTCASFGLGDGFIRTAVKTEAENARLVAALREALP